MVLLGLVIEQPNQTVAHYAQMLEERFGWARFSQSTAHNTLPQMASGRSVRVRRTFEAPDSDGSMHGSMDRYVASEHGERVHRGWMLELPRSEPAKREAMYGRLEFARLEHVPRLIRIFREEEDMYTAMYSKANAELRKLELKRKNRSGPKTTADFDREVQETLLYVDPLELSGDAVLKGIIAERLERIAEEAGIELEVQRSSLDLRGFGA
jgi:hypothetical protein